MPPKRNPTAQLILAACTEQPAAPAELADKLNRGINATYLAVADLEKSGLIRRDEKGRYYVVRENDSAVRENDSTERVSEGLGLRQTEG